MKSMDNTDLSQVTTEDVKQAAPEDSAAYTYKVGMERVLGIAGNLKRNELFRVFANYVQFPLVDHPKKLRSKAENDLFISLLQVAEAKNTLMTHFNKELKEAQDEAADGITQELLKTKTQGESNG